MTGLRFTVRVDELERRCIYRAVPHEHTAHAKSRRRPIVDRDGARLSGEVGRELPVEPVPC
eukprot:scaffold3344_cov35-Tisochrysis_lutea.AAC.2